LVTETSPSSEGVTLTVLDTKMLVLAGIIVWLFLITIILKFFAASSEVRRMSDYDVVYEMTCTVCGRHDYIGHLDWHAIKCQGCLQYIEQKEFKIDKQLYKKG
jgi:hypothetical protein